MERNTNSRRRSFWSRAGLALAVAILAGIPAEGVRGQGACWVRGDVDSSGFVDISDALMTLNKIYVLKECVAEAADVNDNGYVTIADPLYTLNFLFLGTLPNPPAPFPNCGPDPTSGTAGLSAAETRRQKNKERHDGRAHGGDPASHSFAPLTRTDRADRLARVAKIVRRWRASGCVLLGS